VIHTEQSIMSLIRKKFSGSAYVVLSQVRNQTGYGPRTRTADAIVMSLWPSRGLTLSGFEIKRSRSDWKAELDQPEKAEEISRFCDFWNVAAAPGVVELGELPPTWGLYVVQEKREELRLTREAVMSKEVQPITRGFLGALLRAATSNTVPKSEVDKTICDAVDLEVENRMRRQSVDYTAESFKRSLDSALKRIQDFEEASGVHIDEYNSGRIGKAVAGVLGRRPLYVADALESNSLSLQKAAQLVADGVRELRALEQGLEESA